MNNTMEATLYSRPNLNKTYSLSQIIKIVDKS